MDSMLLALALLQHRKNKHQPCFTSPVYEQKSSLVKLSSFHLFGKTFYSPTLKSLPCCKIGSHVLNSWYYVEKQHQTVACYCYQKLRQTNVFKKNLGKCSQIGYFKVRNSTWKTLILLQSPSNNLPQNKSFMGEITRNLVHQSPPLSVGFVIYILHEESVPYPAIFGGASFSTSVARRKTVVQLGSLGWCCKPSPVGSRGETLEIFGYFAF